jgi:hypothetical protein
MDVSRDASAVAAGRQFVRAPVILRIVSGRAPAAALDDVVAAYLRDFVPVAESAAGLDRYLVATRPVAGGEHEIAAMTVWASVEAALATYGGDLARLRTIDGRTHGERFTGVDYYEVDLDGGRRAGGASATATRLRLTAGTVAHGLDADIQQQLRRHLPDLPPEAVDAFVGRRVIGSVVEIALVTTWSEAPAGIDLAQPIWPSISDRYDSFRLGVHDIVLSGVGPG